MLRADQACPAPFFSFASVGGPLVRGEPTLPEPGRLWWAGRPRGAVDAAPPEKGRKKVDADTATTRKPMLLLRLFGLFLLRNEAAALSTLLFHEPPRKTKPGHLTR